LDVLSDRELKELLRNSYQLVFDKMPKKLRTQLAGDVEARPGQSRFRKKKR
jgi:hypothetical protein